MKTVCGPWPVTRGKLFWGRAASFPVPALFRFLCATVLCVAFCLFLGCSSGETASGAEGTIPQPTATLASFTQESLSDPSSESVSGTAPTPVPITVELTQQTTDAPQSAAALPTPEQTAADGIELLMLNVGKGDAILIRYGEKTYLIDGGKTQNAGAILAALEEEGITRLSAVFLTHTDNDHVGVLELLTPAGIAVDRWYASRYYSSPKKESKHPSVVAAALSGQEVTWLSAGDVAEDVFEVLAPSSRWEDEDNNSLVMMFNSTYGRVLLTGDMELDEEAALLSKGYSLQCDVLKIPNHADDDTASELFLQAAGAKLALISTSSEEKPGTPSEHILNALAAMGTKVYKTEGSEKGIRVLMDEKGIRGSYARWEKSLPDYTGLTVEDANPKNDTVTLYNGSGASIDLSGCSLVTERNGSVFVFAKGAALPAGESTLIGSRSADGHIDLLWDAKNILNNKKKDAVFLLDPHGNIIDRLTTNP